MDREIIKRNECVNKIEVFVRNFGKSRLWKGEDSKEPVLAHWLSIVKEALKHSKTHSAKKNVILPPK